MFQPYNVNKMMARLDVLKPAFDPAVICQAHRPAQKRGAAALALDGRLSIAEYEAAMVVLTGDGA